MNGLLNPKSLHPKTVVTAARHDKFATGFANSHPYPAWLGEARFGKLSLALLLWVRLNCCHLCLGTQMASCELEPFHPGLESGMVVSKVVTVVSSSDTP